VSRDPVQEAAALLAAAGIAGRELDLLSEVARGDPARLLELAKVRAGGRPLELLTGRARFLGLELEADPDVLVPREETELLGRWAIEWLRSQVEPVDGLRAIDLCCGAGNLACALAASLPSLRVWGADLTGPAVILARRNVERLGQSDRVSILQGDLLQPFAGAGLEGTIDAMVCNPPYISTGRLAGDRAGLLAHEPREAFDGGPFGFAIHQRVAREAAAFLRPGSPLFMEFGAGQDRQVAVLLKRAGHWAQVEWRADAAGVPRVVKAVRREP
jgi:release factor glutamine methyltransferase